MTKTMYTLVWDTLKFSYVTNKKIIFILYWVFLLLSEVILLSFIIPVLKDY